MPAHRIVASALIEAPPPRVYAIIADYHQGHPQIIPRPPFVSLVVEQGGVGAGTAIRVQMRVLGRLQGFHAVVTEPEPGRVLVETNDNGTVTTFAVEPRAEGQHAQVTMALRAEAKPHHHRARRAHQRRGRAGALVRDQAAAPGLCQGARAVGDGGRGQPHILKPGAG